MIEFSWWQAALLGAVQGFTEFLPVSSSGHLALAHIALGLKELPLSFDVFTHLGTLVAVCIFFWPKIIKTDVKYWFQVGIATIPAVIVGFLAKDAIQATTYSRVVLTVGFLMSALFLFIAQELLAQEDADKKRHPYMEALSRVIHSVRDLAKSKEKKPGTLQSFLIGLMQSLALLPSVSRSGTTLLGALLTGMPREEAFTFIFLMSIPAILGANLLDFIHVWQSGEFFQIPWGPYIVGVIVAGVAGLLSLRFFRALVNHAKLTTFAWYLVFVAFLSFFLV